MGRLWTDQTEPRLDEVLDDPIIRKRMESDGVTREELYRNIETVRKALLAWKRPIEEPATRPW